MREHLFAGGALAVVVLLSGARARAEDVTRVSFEDAIRRAVQRSPTAELAAQEIKRSQALVEQARASWYPTLAANATYTRLDSDRELAGRVIQAADSVNANLQLVVPVVAPRAWSQSARVKEGIEVARLSAEDVRRQVALATGRAFLTVVAQGRVVETSRRARDTARAHEDFARQRFSGGVGNRLDLVRASQERATAETQLAQQELALVRAREALGVLMGEGGPVDVAGEAALSDPPTLAAALGETVTKRSDVVAQRGRAEVTRKAVRDAYVDYLPNLSVVAQPFYQNPATLVFPTTGWQAQLVFSLPLYDGGSRYGLEREREVLHDQARTRLEATVRQARSDVRVAFEAVKRADEALVQAREASRLASEALGLAELAYKAGATSNLEIIDAERRARDADTAAAVAEDAARQARLDLLAACGRFP